jgi:hypothetical protein
MIKSLKPYVMLLVMSDAEKVKEAKNNELKAKYRFVLTQNIEAADKHVRTKTSKYIYVSIFVHVSWHISDFVPSWM